MSEFSVRPARHQDVEPSVEVLIGVAQEPGSLLGWDPPHDATPTVTALHQWIDEGNHGVFVADSAGAIVGSLWVIRARGAGEIRLNVAPAWRSKGVGRAMVEAGVGWARDEKLDKVWLAVYGPNERAVALYERCGFAIEGIQRCQHRTPNGEVWDLVLMGIVLEDLRDR